MARACLHTGNRGRSDAGAAEMNALVKIFRAYLAQESLIAERRAIVRPREILVDVAPPPHEFRLPAEPYVTIPFLLPGDPLEAYFRAVYGFRWRGVWLKVGRATCRPRFVNDHYNPWLTSSLAASLRLYKSASGRENPSIPGLRQELQSWGDEQLGTWIERNTTRYHVFLPPVACTLSDLERLAHIVLKPVFEEERINPASRVHYLSRGRSCLVAAVKRVIGQLRCSAKAPDPALLRHLRACANMIGVA